MRRDTAATAAAPRDATTSPVGGQAADAERDTPEPGADAEVLVEEISIDGMCGVY